MILQWVRSLSFRFVCRNRLVYNTCWEDPRLDRQALELGPDDRVLTITSAGCNALDYLLEEPKQVFAVDINPSQNALLELKVAALRALDYPSFFAMFGQGKLPGARQIYRRQLRGQLAPASRAFWDRNISWFEGSRGSFYFYGTTGTFAWLVKHYFAGVLRATDDLHDMLDAPTLAEQEAIYRERLQHLVWNRLVHWIMQRDTTMHLLGVPCVQRRQVERHYGGIAAFVRQQLDAVFTGLSLRDNYFWRVYIKGSYTPECCPEYLKEESYQRLRAGLLDRLTIKTCALADFLERYPGTISRFVLLDHMDWLAAPGHPVLRRLWQAILDRAAPQARILYRSGALEVEYVNPVEVESDGSVCRVGDLLQYRPDLARELHARDRVHTYGSFYIADFLRDSVRRSAPEPVLCHS